jgi:glycosyltransferase involved in cell wall biosynthesis
MKLNLYAFNRPIDFDWNYGSIRDLEWSVSSVHEGINAINSFEDYTFFWNFNFGYPPLIDISMLGKVAGDLWHCTFDLKLFEFPSILSKVKPCWMLNLFPENSNSFVSWKFYFHGVIFKNQVFRAFNISKFYGDLNYAALDLGYRLIKGGVIPFYERQLFNNRICHNEITIDYKLDEEFKFLKLHFLSSLRLYGLIRLKYRLLSVSAFVSIINCRSLRVSDQIFSKSKVISRSPINADVSVVLITLGRYVYLKEVIKQLLQQTIKPKEILVVDSTPNPDMHRIEELRSLDSIVIVHIHSVVGQCSQRNYAIRMAQGEYVLFMDDDMEDVPTDHLQKHLMNLAQHSANCSNGTPDEVGIVPINRDQQPIVSDVFPTNDTLIRKDLLFKAGLFDTRMDKGQCEDHDLGIRVFLVGGLMIKSFSLKSLHLRAPSGGLRVHGNRKQTYFSSRNRIFHFRLPHKTEIYMKLKYFEKKELSDDLIISLLGTFSARGNVLFKVLKLMSATVFLPINITRIYLNYRAAKKIMNNVSA